MMQAKPLVERRLQVEGHELAVLALNPASAGEPIVLLHGIGGSIRFWSSDQAEVFQTHGPCYALSLPGHYPARFPTGMCKEMITPDMMANVLAEAIRQLVSSRPVTLVGMSTGGLAALAMAALRPGIVRRVISVSGFAQGNWTGALGQFQWLARHGPIGQALFKLVYPMGRVSPSVFMRVWNVYAADSRALYAYPGLKVCVWGCYQDFRRLDLDAMIQYFSVMPEIDISPILPRIATPTLVMAGDRDPIVPPAQARLIAEKIPGAELAMIAGAGHMLFAERPAEYRRVLGEWLGRTSEKGRADDGQAIS
jgi:pimeloyl-ACP methyl ester carboxylesterase